MKRSIVCLLLAVLMVIASVQVGFAWELSGNPAVRFTYITNMNNAFSIVGSSAFCEGSIIANAPSGMTVALTVRLQRSSNGISWTNIDVWTATGKNQATVSGQKTLSTGYYYRTYVYGRVLDENGTRVESAVKYSSAKEY